MDYDLFLSYAFPAFGTSLFLAIAFIGVMILIAKLLKERDMPIGITNALIFGFLIFASLAIFIAWILPWGSPI